MAKNVTKLPGKDHRALELVVTEICEKSIICTVLITFGSSYMGAQTVWQKGKKLTRAKKNDFKSIEKYTHIYGHILPYKFCSIDVSLFRPNKHRIV